MWVFAADRPDDPYRLLFPPQYLDDVPSALRSRLVDRVRAGEGAFALINRPDCGYRFPSQSRGRVEGKRSAAVQSARQSRGADWCLELVAQCGAARDGGNILGVKPNRGAGFQLAEPPLIERSDGT